MLIYDNNGYLERLTHTGLKHLPVFKCTDFHDSTHATHTCAHIHTQYTDFQDSTHTTHMCAHIHTHTHRVLYQGNGTEEKFFEKRKVFKEDLKELTEVE